MQVIFDNCDEIYFNRIFDPDATVEHHSDDVKDLPPHLPRTQSVSKTVKNFFHHCLHLQPKK